MNQARTASQQITEEVTSWPGVEAGRLDATPSRVFGFEQIREAHRAMEANEAGGKMVVVVDLTAHHAAPRTDRGRGIPHAPLDSSAVLASVGAVATACLARAVAMNRVLDLTRSRRGGSAPSLDFKCT